MAVLNLRNVPDELMRDLRKAAIDAGVPFHQYCVGLLGYSLILHGALPPRPDEIMVRDLPTGGLRRPVSSDIEIT